MVQKRKVNNATKRELIRDRKSDVTANSVNDNKKMKRETMYTLPGGIKIISPERVRQRGISRSAFLRLFIFFQLNLSSL